MKKFFYDFLFLISFSNAYSQWERCNGPYGGNVIALAISGNNIFVGAHGGVYLSKASGLDIFSYAPKSYGAEDFFNLTIEIIKL